MLQLPGRVAWPAGPLPEGASQAGACCVHASDLKHISLCGDLAFHLTKSCVVTQGASSTSCSSFCFSLYLETSPETTSHWTLVPPLGMRVQSCSQRQEKGNPRCSELLLVSVAQVCVIPANLSGKKELLEELPPPPPPFCAGRLFVQIEGCGAG